MPRRRTKAGPARLRCWVLALLNPAESRSEPCPIRSSRKFCLFVNAEVWVRRVRVLRFLKGGTDRLRRRDCCFDRSTGRPLAGFVQAPAVGGLSLARDTNGPASGARGRCFWAIGEAGARPAPAAKRHGARVD